MQRSIFVLLIGLVYTSVSFCQLVLKGRISASDTHKPVVAANVFLSNTSVGTISDENGEFIITRFPEGRFNLVVSFVGYETYIINLHSNSLPGKLEVILIPKVEELPEVIVETYEKNGWEKWGKFFLNNFIGTSANATECKLLNKEIVKFRYDKKTNTLYAFADDQLVIENKALGYIIKYQLVKFAYNYPTRIFYYLGYPLFEEMENSKKNLQKKWIDNRRDAYYGSLMHFMRTIYRNKLTEEGFEVRKLLVLPNEERIRVHAIYEATLKKTLTKGDTVFFNHNADKRISKGDSTEYYERVLLHPEEFNVLVDKILPGDSIAYALDSITAVLDFTDHLQIKFPAKKFPQEYYFWEVIRKKRRGPVISDIYLINDKPVEVLTNGSFFEGINLLTEGYWSWWEKMANILPFDYWPPPKK